VTLEEFSADYKYMNGFTEPPTSESCEQQKMRLEDAEKYVKDGVEYTVTYEASGLATCVAPEDEFKVPQQGDPGWVSYTMKFTASKPDWNMTLKRSKSVRIQI